MTKKKIEKVEVNADSLEALADNIAALSEVGKMIQKSRLTKRLTWLLIKDLTGVSFADIEKVLEALPRLEKVYLK